MPPYPGTLTEMQRRRWMVLVLTSVGFFMGTLDSTVVAVALPSIGPSLRLSYSEALWIQAAYLLAISIFLVPIGRLADRHGRTRFYMTGTALFALFSFACGFAFNGTSLIVARALQGASAAFMSATSTALVTSVFPTEERGRALGLNAMAGYTGLTLGPVVGGLLATHVGWRWIFFINVPIALLNLVSGGYLLQAERRDQAAERRAEVAVERGRKAIAGAGAGQGGREAVAEGGAEQGGVGRSLANLGAGIDRRGVLLFALMLSALTVSLTFGPFWGWSSLPTIGLLVGSVVVFGIFTAVERKVPDPMLDLTVIRKNRLFMATTGAALLSYMAGFGVTTFTAVFLEIVEGYSAQHTGLILLTQPIFMVVLSGVFGRLSDRVGTRLPTTVGMILVALGMVGLGILPTEAHPLYVVLALAVSGIGTASFSAPNTSAVMGSVQRGELSFAAGYLATMRTMGQAVSVALLGGIAAAGLGPAGGRVLFLGEKASEAAVTSFSSGYRTAMLVGAVLALAGAAASMVREKPIQDRGAQPGR